jgi:hypothetical protein
VRLISKSSIHVLKFKSSQGVSLWKKLKAAVPKAAEEAGQFESFSSTILPDTVATFRSQVEAWEDDIKQLNPFKPTIKCKQ